MRRPIAKDGERGFALLLVFLMAAAVALMLYQQMPRVAFESEREKEQALQDRGLQYVRGIQLYYVAFKKYPAKIEDLESSNNKRFLRRRYIDPMTGKDEWRLIHVNASGQLIDSLVQKPPSPNNADSHDANNPLAAFGTGAGSGTATTTPADAPPPAVNATVYRRPSDNTLPGSNGAPPTVDPNDPSTWAPATTWVPPQPGNGQSGTQSNSGQFPGQQFPGQQLPGQPGQLPGQLPFQQFPGQQTGASPGGFQPAFPGQLPFQQGTNPSLNQGAGMQNGSPFQPAQPGAVYGQFSQPGLTQPGAVGAGALGGAGSAAAAGTTTDALGAINNALRTPQTAQTGPTNAIGTGGLVGVASMSKDPSIKIYKDRQKYSEWEFIFDLKSATQGQGQNGQMGLGQGAPGASPNGQPGQNGTNSSGSGSSGSSIFPNGNSIFPTSPASSTTTNH
jgi:hypothetical protein